MLINFSDRVETDVSNMAWSLIPSRAILLGGSCILSDKGRKLSGILQKCLGKLVTLKLLFEIIFIYYKTWGNWQLSAIGGQFKMFPLLSAKVIVSVGTFGLLEKWDI